MVHWPFRLIDNYCTARSGRLARAGSWTPQWLVRRIAEAKLVHTLRHVWKHSPVQRERWQAAGVRWRDLGSPEVLPRIPFCDGKALAADPQAYLCVSPDEVVSMILTSGTSGVPKEIYFTAEDLDRQARMIGGYLRRLPGASRVLIIFNLFSQPASSPALIALRGAEKAGMFALLCESLTIMDTAIDLIRNYRLDTIVSSPTRLLQLTLGAGVDLKALGVKYILLSAEPWSETTRRALEEAWGAKALDVYGSNETACGIASECAHQNGLHVGEINHWLEIIDPATGAVLPDGEPGEIVITTLSRRGMPLVRYRIGDLAKLLPPEGRCACGLVLRKLSRIRGRVDQMVILGGGYNVYPEELDRAVLGIPGAVDYQVVFEKDGYRDVLHLDVEIDMPDETLREAATTALGKVYGIHRKLTRTRDLDFGRIRSVPRGSLSAGRNKTTRIVDRRGN